MTYTQQADRSDAEAPGRPSASPLRLLKGIAVGAWSQHRDLLRNAGSLLATTGVTSILGAAYWTVSARFFAQQSVGYAAVEIPAMTLLGTIGMLGLGTLLVGELPKSKNRAELASAALLTCAAGSLVLGVGFALLAPHFNERFAAILGPLDQKALFVLGAMLTSVSMVLDMATIGVMRGGIQLARNLAFSVIKLAILPVFAVTLHDALGFGIVFSWIIGIGASLLLIVARNGISRGRSLATPDWTRLRQLARIAMAHNWLEIAITAPPAVFPVLVTLLVSPAANAAFYVAYTLSTFIYMVPSHMSTVLFAIAAAEPEAIAHRVRFAGKLSYAIGLPVVAVLALGSHWILSIYGPGYARIATIPMSLIALGYIPSVPKALYIAICRAQGRTTFVATLLTVFTIIEIGGALVGGIFGGLTGLSLAILLVLTAQGLSITPSILRVILPRRGLAPSGPPVGVGEVSAPAATADALAPAIPVSYLAGPRESQALDLAVLARNQKQQDAGIRALIELAQSLTTTGGFPRLEE